MLSTVNKKLIFGFLFSLSSLMSAQAQDYPYDDVDLKNSEEPAVSTESPAPESNAPQNRGTTTPKTAIRKRVAPLFRIGLKVGGTYAFFQNRDPNNNSLTNTFSGFGMDALLAFGWDLPYQPLFIEIESGYRGLLLNEISKLHVVPLNIALHYRARMGRTSVWKPGLKSSLDLRIADHPNGGKSFGIYPAISISSMFEFNDFVVEPLLTISRIEPQFNFIVSGIRLGYRF